MQTTPSASIAAKATPSPSRWAARVGLGVALAMLVACFGVLIASSRASIDSVSTPAAVDAR